MSNTKATPHPVWAWVPANLSALYGVKTSAKLDPALVKPAIYVLSLPKDFSFAKAVGQ